MLKVTMIAILALCTIASQTANAQTATVVKQEKTTPLVNWLTWEEAMELAKEENRKILLDVYTDWCKWCKHMENTTFRQPEIVTYINENFFPVKLNAEQREELEYRDKVYKYVKNGQMGYHELAAELLRGRLSFPALVFLDEEMNVIQSFVGYKTPQQLEQIATYFASDHYKKTPWSTYQRMYKSMLAD